MEIGTAASSPGTTTTGWLDVTELPTGTTERLPVSIPILNPAGIRLDQRNSYYHDEDPNRYFPYDVGDRTSPPSVQELIDGRIFDRFSATADALVSLHEGWINEALYTIVERVRYGRDRSRDDAEELAARTMDMAEAFDLPIIREHDVDVQEAYGLQRSFECAAVNAAGVPAVTPELGRNDILLSMAARDDGDLVVERT